MLYHSRNLANLEKLAPNTKYAAKKWYQFCIDNKIDILIYETIRTKQQQAQYVANGVSKTMKSYHLVGQALDFVPIVNGKTSWSKNTYGKKPFITAIEYAEKIGFESGYRWGWDAPHLQFNYKGYGTDKVLTIADTEQEEDEMLKERFAPIEQSKLTSGQLNMLKRLAEIGAISKTYKPSLNTLETMSIIDSAFKNTGFYDYAKKK